MKAFVKGRDVLNKQQRTAMLDATRDAMITDAIATDYSTVRLRR